MSRAVTIALAAATAVALALAARSLDVAAAVRAVGHLALAPWLVAIALVVAKLGAKLARSHRVLVAATARPPPVAATARVLLASHAAGQLAWSPLGFTVRTLGLRACGLPVATIVRVHGGERVAEATALGVLVLAALACAPTHVDGRAVLVAAAVTIAVLALALLARRGHLRAWALPLPALAIAAAWALVAAALDVVLVAAAARAAGVSLDPAAALVATAAITGGTAIPLAPAQLGVLEAAFVVALGWSGVAAEPALTAALAYRLAHAAPLVVLGGPALVATATE